MDYFRKKLHSYMFNYVVNVPLTLVINDALLNGTDVINVEQWTKMYSACVTMKFIFESSGLQSCKFT